MEKYNWCLDIHDAFIVCPEAAVDVRKWYCEELEGLHARRQTILANYFNSIGIGAEAQTQWEQVKAKVVPLEGKFKCNRMALK